MNKLESLKKKYRKREGFGVCGSSLALIAEDFAKQYGSKHIEFKLPYHNFNCKGTANRIAKEVCGLMPFTKKEFDIEKATTLFYGDKLVNKCSYYLPFQSECDVFFIESIIKSNNVLVVNLIKAPCWREYL